MANPGHGNHLAGRREEPPQRARQLGAGHVGTRDDHQERTTGKPLRVELEGLHAARRGQYRVIYRMVDDVVVVEVVSIALRREAYS